MKPDQNTQPEPVVLPGELKFAVAGLAHGHIYGMVKGLLDAGAELVGVWDDDSQKISDFRNVFPQAQAASNLNALLDDPDIRVIAGASIPNDRCSLGLQVMRAGKDYFVDKPPMTTLDQLAAVRSAVKETGRKYMVYYSERLHSEAATYADQLIRRGEIGQVLHIEGFGPHRLGNDRPDWFYEKSRYGGILCDIGSHQLEQFLHFTGAEDANITFAHKCNYDHPKHPEFEDFGECTVTASNGATGYFRVDWFTPDGLRNWGDGRTFILGTNGYIELRKYVDLAADQKRENMVYWANQKGEFKIDATGQVGFPFFTRFIRDCIDRTETAMTQEHALLAAELSLKAQLLADNVSVDNVS